MFKIGRQTLFISGATSGLGLEVAEHFVKSGWSVLFCARNHEDVIDTENKLRILPSGNQTIIGFTNDVSNYETTRQMVESLLESNVNIDVLICNAGVIGPINKFLESDLQVWREAFDINLHGTINLIISVLPSMVERRVGRVVHISGGGATSPLSGMSSYAASKAAAVRFIETLSLEYREAGIFFNSIAPGMLKTKLLYQMLDAGREKIGDTLFKKSSGRADASSDSTEKVLRLLDFLTSDESSGITGRLISAEWDNWMEWPKHLNELENSDLFTIRRITGRDRGLEWGDL